jgi:hypothetical protein
MAPDDLPSSFRRTELTAARVADALTSIQRPGRCDNYLFPKRSRGPVLRCIGFGVPASLTVKPPLLFAVEPLGLDGTPHVLRDQHRWERCREGKPDGGHPLTPEASGGGPDVEPSHKPNDPDREEENLPGYRTGLPPDDPKAPPEGSHPRQVEGNR